VHRPDGNDQSLTALARKIVAADAGMLIQGRLSPETAIACRFGNRPWFVRLFVLLTEGAHA
jgi:hypothetical protein